MDDIDKLLLAVAVGLVAVSGVLTARQVRQQEEDLAKLREDVVFLMDRPPVSREAEAS